MEHQRLNDLVYVRYNLRLHQRISFRGKNYDPISFEDFADNGKWILEDDPPLLTADEIEEFRKQMAGLRIQTNENNDEILNMDEFDSGDEIEDPSINNTKRVQEDGTQSVETRETIGEDLGHADPNNDMYQGASITECHFT